jgi:hypothetical protein
VIIVPSTTFWGAVIGGVRLSRREQWTRLRQS